MPFAPLKDNFFIITFKSEGDYRFVARGGPWIRKGVACLIAPFQDNARPSETVLDYVPIWVRFYDVPWNKQTVAYGEFVGSNLGKVMEVDIDQAQLEFSDYLRVRIALPLNKRLQTCFTAKLKGQAGTMVSPLRYERVPYFCFHCGFIGHNKEEYEKRVWGVPSLCYDESLRCSPKKKYMRRPMTASPAAKRNLFSSPAEIFSSLLGKPNFNGMHRASSNRGIRWRC